MAFFKQKTFIIQDLDPWNLLLAIALKFIGAQIFYMNLTLSSQTDVWMKRLSEIGIHRFGCEVSLPNGYLLAEAQKVARNVARRIFKKHQQHNFFKRLMCKIGGNKFEKELGIVVRHKIYIRAYPLAELIVFTKRFEEEKGDRPILICDNNTISQMLLESENLRNIEARIYTYLRFVCMLSLKFILPVFLYLLNKLKNSRSNSINDMQTPMTQKKFKVVYFPHSGIDSGGLFIKDQYYSHAEGHPLNPKNILHLGLND